MLVKHSNNDEQIFFLSGTKTPLCLLSNINPKFSVINTENEYNVIIVKLNVANN